MKRNKKKSQSQKIIINAVKHIFDVEKALRDYAPLPDSYWRDEENLAIERQGVCDNFLAMLFHKLYNGMDWTTALKTSFMFEKDLDKLQTTREKIMNMLSVIAPGYDKDIAYMISLKTLRTDDWDSLDINELRTIFFGDIK